MKLPNTRELFLFPAQSYATVELQNSEENEIQNGSNHKRLVIAHTKVRTKQFKHVRNDILMALTEQYNIVKQTFQSELLSLHCEVDNYKPVETSQNK
eukprot:227949_1